MEQALKRLLALFALGTCAALCVAAPLNSHNLCSKTRETVVNLADVSITDAAKAGDVSKVGAALKSGVSPNATTYEGFSLLHIAIVENQDAVLDLLLQAGADVNQPFMGSSPLSLVGTSNRAGVPGDQKREEQLTRAGATLSDFDIAFEAVRKLGVRSLARGFIESITKGDMARLELYVRATYDINAPLSDGISPLHIAAIQGPPNVVRYLVGCGANVNARTKRGAPVLWFARERPEIAEVLRNLGATEKD